MNCPFCEIIAGRANAEELATRDGAVSFRPLNPVAEGHTLVVPDRHVPYFQWLGERELASLMRAAQEAAQEVLERHAPDGYNLIQSNGRGSTQTVPHVHFHIVPRNEGDGLALPWDPSTVPGLSRAEFDEMARVAGAPENFACGCGVDDLTDRCATHAKLLRDHPELAPLVDHIARAQRLADLAGDTIEHLGATMPDWDA